MGGLRREKKFAKRGACGKGSPYLGGGRGGKKWGRYVCVLGGELGRGKKKQGYWRRDFRYAMEGVRGGLKYLQSRGRERGNGPSGGKKRETLEKGASAWVGGGDEWL